MILLKNITILFLKIIILKLEQKIIQQFLVYKYFI